MGLKRQISEEKRKVLGDRLRIIREGLNLTQDQMAELLEISKSHYGLAERGINCLSLGKYLILHEEFDVDLTYLLTGKEPYKIVVSDIIDDCPKDKVFYIEQLIRYARELYR